MSSDAGITLTRPRKRSGLTGRSAALDAVRVVGIIAIVAGHNWGDRHWVSTWLYTWHVPVFFVITGYLWKPGRTVLAETRNRARTLLVPYLVWLVVVSGIYFALRVNIGWSVDGELVSNVLRGGWFAARPYSAFWFITALFFAAVMMRIAERLHPALPWAVGTFGVIWATLDPNSMKHIWEGAGLAVAGVAFMCLGRAFRTYRPTIEHPLGVGLVLLVPGLILGIAEVVAPLNMKSADLGTPIAGVIMAASISFGMILVAEALEPLAPEWSRRLATVLAQLALPVLFLHALVLIAAPMYGIPLTKWTALAALLLPGFVALGLRATPLRRFVM